MSVMFSTYTLSKFLTGYVKYFSYTADGGPASLDYFPGFVGIFIVVGGGYVFFVVMLTHSYVCPVSAGGYSHSPFFSTCLSCL